MQKSSFDVHIAAALSGRVTKSNVIGTRKALNTAARRAGGGRVAKCAPVVTTEQFDALFTALGDCRPVIEGELHDSGIKQINNRRYRKQLGAVSDLIPLITRFRLVDFYAAGRRGEYFVPVYRAETADGESGFRFINIPWQSGGNGPEVLY